MFLHTSYEQPEVQVVCELVVVEEYQGGRAIFHGLGFGFLNLFPAQTLR